MPNTSAAILKSATAISPSKHATAEHIQTAIALFETIGLVSVVEEEDMHAVTALSGSGPAYIYYVVEAMEAAAKIGLKEDVAKSLILQTMIGAAEMLKASEKHPSILRKEITSPGGTTEAGIEVLQEHKFQQALISCITQAAQRSHNLGKTLEQLTKKIRNGAQSYLSSISYKHIFLVIRLPKNLFLQTTTSRCCCKSTFCCFTKCYWHRLSDSKHCLNYFITWNGTRYTS